MKAQTTAEEAMNHLKVYMAEHDSSEVMFLSKMFCFSMSNFNFLLLEANGHR